MRIPPSIYYKLGRFLLFVGIEFVCILCIYNNGLVQKFKLIEYIRGVEAYFWKKRTAIAEYSKLRDINANLAEENRVLLQEVARLKALDTSAFARHKEFPFRFINAKIIKNTIGSTHNYILLDKGYKDGIQPDMGVITPKGVIGIVWAAGENVSYVTSFLNTQQQVSAKIGKSQTFGPLTWDGTSTNKAHLTEIPQHLEITPGDTVYTSGYSSLYPPDIPLGIVTGSKIIKGTHQTIDITLFEDFTALSNVMVVYNTNIDHIKAIEERANGK